MGGNQGFREQVRRSHRSVFPGWTRQESGFNIKKCGFDYRDTLHYIIKEITAIS